MTHNDLHRRCAGKFITVTFNLKLNFPMKNAEKPSRPNDPADTIAKSWC